MNCKEWQKGFKEWLTREWIDSHTTGATLPEGLQAHCIECAECRKRFIGASLLVKTRSFQDEVPKGLAERIQKTVLLRRRQKKGIKPSWIMMPLAAAALVVVTFVTTLLFFTTPETHITITLIVEAPHAQKVSVVGDWNRWDPEADVLEDSDRDGVWEIQLTLEKNNEYRYQFLVDEKEWIPDPLSPVTVKDGFGGINSVLDI
jgi:hypothetical protein